MTAVTETHAAARTYADGGWQVFPLWWVVDGPDGLRCACPDWAACKSPGKHPIGKLGREWMAPKGVKDASDRQREVDRWWSLAPEANIGLPAHANGLAIIDVDPAHGGERSLIRVKIWMVDHGYQWPDGHAGGHRILTQHTGSGGQHYLFTAPAQGIPGKAPAFEGLPGVDTRGRGGYIVVAPSRHVCGGLYRWEDFFAPTPPWPTVLDELLSPPKVLESVAVSGHVPQRFDHLDGYAAAVLSGELERITASAQGERNHQLHLSAFKVGQFVAGGAISQDVAHRELCAAGRLAGLSEREIGKTVASGMTAGAAKPRDGGL